MTKYQTAHILLIIWTLLFYWFAAPVDARSPYEIESRKELIMTGTGLVIGGLGTFLTRQIDPLTPAEISGLNRQDINAFDRPATYNYSGTAKYWSDILVGSCLLVPATLFSQKLVRDDWQTFSIMYLETLIFSNFVPLISKGRVQRIRPYVYNEAVPMENKLDPNARRSFYSGHTTNAFASAVFFSVAYSHYYPDSRWKPFIWVGSLGLASLVGYLRFEAGKHFPTDILMGAAVGSIIGFLVPYLHRTENSEKGTDLTSGPSRNVGFQMQFQF